MKQPIKRKGRRKKVNFNPTSDYIKEKIEEYLSYGGTITKVMIEETDLNQVIINSKEADEFLLGK